jgi:low molecular weight protein-tyrosine phosphatase
MIMMSQISRRHLEIGEGDAPLKMREPSIVQSAASHQLGMPMAGAPSIRESHKVTIAMICTANRCRSPLAEHIMRAEAVARGLSVHVFSMGLLESGLPMPERGIAIAREFGVDLSRHRSQNLRLDRLAGVDLVLGMSRGHGREVLAALPEVWPRVFTLKQFSRFVAGKAIPRRTGLASWIEAEGEVRARYELLGREAYDDIADPLRASAAEWRHVIREIRSCVTQILDDCRPLLNASHWKRQK